MGLCVGDALGVPVEFVSRESLQRDPVTGMRGYGVHNQPPGTWSDDTSMTLCLLDSLAHGLDYIDIMQRFVSWMYEGKYTPHGEVFDIGRITKRALFRFGRGEEPLQCGGRSEFDNGNGSLMRLLPLIFILYTRYGFPPAHVGGTSEDHECATNAAFDILHNVSSLTHAHARSHLACGMYVSIASWLMIVGLPFAIDAGMTDAADYYAKKEPYAEELQHFARICGRDSLRDFAKLPQEAIRSDGYVVHTLEAALWCLLNTDSYESCVLKAVNLGGDTDTTAAVAGGLAGLAYGPQAIPEAWKEPLARREYIEDLCENLYVAFCRHGAEKLRTYIPWLERIVAPEEQQGGSEDQRNGTGISNRIEYRDLLAFMGDVYTLFLGYTPTSKIRRITGGELQKIWSKEFIASADLETVQSILSYFVDKERICGGIWYKAASNGTFLALVHRLNELLLKED